MVQYEPELFPGLIYRMQQPKIVLLIFVSGKVVLTGAKRREDLIAAFELIYPVLKEFKKGGERSTVVWLCCVYCGDVWFNMVPTGVGRLLHDGSCQ